MTKMENRDTAVSLDHLVRSLLALGFTQQGLGKMIASNQRTRIS
jgi:hypothetical protein